MAERFDVALRLLVNELKAAGITRADTDPTKLTAPCVWVSPKTFEAAYLDGDMNMTTHVAVIAPDFRQSQALAMLADTLDVVLGVIDPDGEIEAATISLPGSGQSNLPALLFETTLEVKGH